MNDVFHLEIVLRCLRASLRYRVVQTAGAQGVSDC